MEKLKPDERADAIGRIQRYFREERGEDLGDLAAGIMLDFIETDIAPSYYNRGLRDAKTLALRVQGLFEDELASLEMLNPRTKRAQERARE